MANLEHVEIVKQGAKAIEEWRVDNPNVRLDLDDADLSGANLASANLTNSNLERSNLKGAVLNSAWLKGADLTEAVFSDSQMVDAFFHSAIVTGAKFNNANLERASFFGSLLRFTELNNANLDYANFSYAVIQGGEYKKASLIKAEFCHTAWHDVDLSQLIGLEEIQHTGPSFIDINSLTRSKGDIPEAFLRGCGLSDEFISYIPSLFSGAAIDFYSCFISYSHEDKSFARRLHDALQGRGIRCWLDEHQILPGDNIYDRIDHGIRVWDKVLLCASRHSLTSGWVNDELKHAFAKEKQLFKERGSEVLSLIPLNLDGYLFSGWDHPNKNQVTERMAPDFTGWESDNAKFEQQLKRVVKALQTNNTGREPEPPSKL